MRMAEIQIAAKDNAAALESLRKALAIKPDLVEAQRMLIALDSRPGASRRRWRAARDVQKQRPNESIGYLLEGDIYARQKAWTEAIAAYRNGLKKVGHDGSWRSGWPRACAQARAVTPRRTTSPHRGSRTIRRIARSGTIWRSRRSKKKDYAGREPSSTRRCSRSQPNDALALNNLAWVAGQLKDPKALEYAEKADKLAPNNPAILDTYGMLLVEKGDTARGVEMLQKAVGARARTPRDSPQPCPGADQGRAEGGREEGAGRPREARATSSPSQAEVAKLMQSL